MAHHYSLHVNDRFLGPYERRMIVGMRVKNLVKDDQQLQRDDGLLMSVAELMQDRLESARLPNLIEDPPDDHHHATPSTGMWPVFMVRFGADKPHVAAQFGGFRGQGTLSYQGDELRIRSTQQGASQADGAQLGRLPLAFIESSMVDGAVLELVIKPPTAEPPGDAAVLLRIDFANEAEAAELWDLLNLQPGEVSANLLYAPTSLETLR